jgi:acyl carrier protein
VFPELDSSQIPQIQFENTAEWDSLKAVVLLSVIEEEFDLRIPPSEIGRLQSFVATLDYLTPLTGA